jgi:hypothetical protein
MFSGDGRGETIPPGCEPVNLKEVSVQYNAEYDGIAG